MTSSAAVGDETLASARVVVARQPITNLHREVVAYELLYRPRRPDAPPLSGELMTAHVVLGALTIGIDQLVGDKTMFCNAERGALTGETPVTLPPDRTVIEVLETVAVDDETVEGCRQLVEAGYRIALDDFTWAAGVERLLELAAVVKIDFRAISRTDMPGLVARCRAYDVVLLAEKVETEEEITWAIELGFELFQGYAIERPDIVRGQGIRASALAHVELAMTLLTQEIDFDHLEEILRREPGLVVQLLQMASVGSHFGMRRQVQTVREALVLLGTTRIRQWVALTILSSQPGGSPDGLATALVRARMAEVLARSRGLPAPEFAFTAGLLSALDLLLGVALDELDETMDIDEVLKEAAFRRTGPVGTLVAEVTRYQDCVDGGPDAAGLACDLDDAAAASFTWAMPFVAGVGTGV